MESASYRLSNFKNQNVSQIYESMSKFHSSTTPAVKTVDVDAQAALNAYK